MNAQAKIENLTLNIGGRVIELTLDEAKALQVELNQTLGDSRPVVYYPIPAAIPERPFWDQGPTCIPLRPSYPIITCQSHTNVSIASRQ